MSLAPTDQPFCLPLEEETCLYVHVVYLQFFRIVFVLLWLHSSLKPHQMVNQFPCEEVFTCKDLMLITARRARAMFPPKSHDQSCSKEFPLWLPETYNVVYELPRFVKRFLEQQERYNTH